MKDRAEEAPDVKQKGEFFHILAVKPGLYIDFQLVPAIDLRPAGQPRDNVVGSVLVPLRQQILLIP